MTLRDQPVAHLARDVGLRAPDEAAVGDLVDDAVGGLRRQPEEGDLVAILDDPQVPQDQGGGLEHDCGQRGLEPQQLDRPQAVGDAEAGNPIGEQLPHAPDRVLGLLPGRDRQPPGGGRGAGARRGGLEARDEQSDRALGGQNEHRQPLQGHRRIAGEVPEVRTDAHEEGIEASRPGSRLGTRQALDVAGGGDGRPGRLDRRRAHSRGASAGPAGGDSTREPGAGTGTPSHAAIAAWPSSKSFR